MNDSLYSGSLQVALVASHSSGCSFLYPDQNQSNSDIVLRQQDGQYEVFYHLETTIKEKVAAVMKTDLQVNSSECLLSGAMTKALCYINRLQSVRKESERFCPRLLVISSTNRSNTSSQSSLWMMREGMKSLRCTKYIIVRTPDKEPDLGLSCDH